MQETDMKPLDADRLIRVELMKLGEAVRKRAPFLKHQDAIGGTIFVVSCALIVMMGLLYAKGAVPAFIAFVANAFFMSLLHELEHDLIHHLYFKDNPRVYNVMMAGVWLFRPSTISPWVRRTMHLHHHKVSGNESDMEERAITLGEPFGLRRLLMMADGLLSVFLRLRTFKSLAKTYAEAQSALSKESAKAIRLRNRLSYLPIGAVHFLLWHSFIILHASQLVGSLIAGRPVSVAPHILPVLDFLAVVWLGPNVLRSFCINFVSSNMHYYEDNAPKSVVQQTQVWTAAWTYPLQLFCFNFGGSHAIHHFVVRDPFYIRQMIAGDAQQVLRAHGVRFNDFGTFRRNNRYQMAARAAESAHASEDEVSVSTILPSSKLTT